MCITSSLAVEAYHFDEFENYVVMICFIFLIFNLRKKEFKMVTRLARS